MCSEWNKISVHEHNEHTLAQYYIPHTNSAARRQLHPH